MAQNERPKIGYSCYYSRSRDGEQFVPEHVFRYQIAGRLTITDNSGRTHIFKEGDFGLIRRNNLVKYIKEPPPGGMFESVSVYLDQQCLGNFSLSHAGGKQVTASPDTVLKLSPHPLYKGYMDSLQPYSREESLLSGELQQLKVNEALLILLQTEPALAGTLFDFNEPGKIDLAGFMEKNFQFNVQMSRFAYLTGRSLATFKRDFEKTFKTTPGKWLQQRRLQEAFYLIKEKGLSPSEIYLDLGFENLSHFSYAFKHTFGTAPSKIS